MTQAAPPDAAPPALDGAYAWTRLALSLAVALIGNAGMWAVILVMPAVEADFGLDRADASIPYATTMTGFAIGNLLIGRMVDRMGAGWTLAGAGLALAAAFWAAAGAESKWMLSAVQLVIGLGSAAGFAPLIADISHWFARRRGVAVAAAASGNYLSGAVWPLVLAPWLVEGDWRGAYLVLALASGAVMAPLSLALLRRPPEAHLAAADAAAARAKRESGIGSRALIWLLAVAGVACCVAMSMPQVHIVAMCVDLGYGAAAGGEMLSLMLAAGVVSRVASGFAADRFGGVPTLLAGSTLQMIALTLYLPFDGLASLYVVSFIFGLSQGGIVPSYAVIVREYLPAREAGARVGFVIMSTIVGMALGGWVSGWLFDVTGNYAAALLNGIAFNALNIAVMAALLLRTTGGARPAPA
ncbi:MAG: MFS transporter [Pseudomonadota bacterium]